MFSVVSIFALSISYFLTCCYDFYLGYYICFFVYQWFRLVISSCEANKERNIQLAKADVISIMATKLYETKISFHVSFVCSSICASDETCSYMTVDKVRNICSIYRQGSTLYNATQLSTFIVQARINKVK